MNKHLNIKYFIATDKNNLLIDNENILIYSIKKIYYKIYLKFTDQFEPIIIK
tara:strand:+ start:1490 stop:1645 length:156 start_codon:yes stop_codon:yes gene_type:complete